jgi:hypothetical protein
VHFGFSMLVRDGDFKFLKILDNTFLQSCR